jgi:hypothetical protein
VMQFRYPYSPWGLIAKTGTAQVGAGTAATPADAWLISEGPYTYQSGSIPPLTIVSEKDSGGDGGYNNAQMQATIYNDIFTQVDKNVQQPAAIAGDFCTTSGFLQ